MWMASGTGVAGEPAGGGGKLPQLAATGRIHPLVDARRTTGKVVPRPGR
jgi:hypothetical protein